MLEDVELASFGRLTRHAAALLLLVTCCKGSESTDSAELVTARYWTTQPTERVTGRVSVAGVYYSIALPKELIPMPGDYGFESRSDKHGKLTVHVSPSRPYGIETYADKIARSTTPPTLILHKEARTRIRVVMEAGPFSPPIHMTTHMLLLPPWPGPGPIECTAEYSSEPFALESPLEIGRWLEEICLTLQPDWPR